MIFFRHLLSKKEVNVKILYIYIYKRTGASVTQWQDSYHRDLHSNPPTHHASSGSVALRREQKESRIENGLLLYSEHRH